MAMSPSSAGVGEGEDEHLRDVPDVVPQRRLLGMRLGGDRRARQIEPDAGAQQGNAADDLNYRAVLADGTRDGVDAQGGAERDQPVSGHDADPGRHAAEEPALDGALDAEQVDRSEGHGQQDAHGHADWYDEGVGNVSHGGPTASPASALRPCPGSSPA